MVNNNKYNVMKKLLTLFTALIVLGSMTIAKADTWTPAGTPASVFGSEWDAENASNDMTLSNGLYVFAKKQDFSSSTSISFKVCKNHAWTTAYPASNKNYTIPAGAKYLIITYKDDNTHAVDAVGISSMTVAGDNATLLGETWSPSTEANDMTLQSDGTYKFEREHVTLPEGAIYFKACANHAWDKAWPSDNYELSIPESGDYTITITFNPATLAVNATATLEQPVVVIPTIQLHSDITNPAWETSAEFVVAANEETASLTLTDVAKGTYHFGIKKDGAWTSNSSAFTRANNSHAITGDNGNCTFNADRNGDYTFTWTFASNTLTITYPAIPAQSVAFNGLASQVLKGSIVNFADFVTSSGIDNPGYRFYVKEKNASYGSAVSSYTFDAVGEYRVKVEALEDNTGDPVADDESDVLVYDTYTFTNGTRIYVDFSAVSGDAKGVNYPLADAAGLDYDGTGAGTIKVVTFSQDVEWSTTQDFIKTQKAGWDPGSKFSVPAAGQNHVVVAADGASYTWSTFVPSTYYLKNKWNDCENWTWKEMTAVGDGTFRLEEVVYGGEGINYNFVMDDPSAQWKEASKIKYLDGATPKVVALFDTINLVLDPAQDTIWAEMVHKDDVVYTVAGSSLALFDLGWAPSHPWGYTKMDKQADGTYKWNHSGEEVVLPAGDVELKVIKNGAYENGCWPEIENFKYEIKRSGEYNIIIHFNACTKAIWIDTTLIKPLNIQALSLKGSWDGWNEAKSFTLGGENDKSLATLSLTAGTTYQFKIVDGQNKWYGNGEAFTRDDISHRDVEEVTGGANMTIQVDKTGEYLFTYFFDTKQLLIQYPAIVPEEKIAALSGKFTINNSGETVEFSRGNLQYNYESDEWYTAEKQYEALGDLNLRFGDDTYQGSIDMFGWSCESSDFGKQWKYKDGDFTGAFVDWGTKFADDFREWSTLTEDEWKYIMDRKKGNNKLWTMIAIGPDSLNGLALLPDNWTAPACASNIVYGFYNLDDEVNYKKNSFTFAQWAELEASGVVFLPLAGTRAGYYGNTWSGSAETTLSNPLATGYDWVDNVNWMGYYWLSTPKNATQVATAILPGWHEEKWNVPAIWDRERRRGQPVRLVTRKLRDPDFSRTDMFEPGVIGTVCVDYNVLLHGVEGATFYELAGLTDGGKLAFDEITAGQLNAGVPYLFQASANELKLYYGTTTVPSPVNPGNGMYGTFDPIDVTENLDDVYYFAQHNFWSCSGMSSLHMPANRAYVRMSEVPSAAPNPNPGRRRIMMGVNASNTTTGIDEITNDQLQMTNKVIIDGHLFIIRGEKVYDTTGRQIK